MGDQNVEMSTFCVDKKPRKLLFSLFYVGMVEILPSVYVVVLSLPI